MDAPSDQLVLCSEIVKTFTDLTYRIRNSQLSSSAALDQWTDYVNSCNTSPAAHAAEVQDVLANLSKLMAFPPVDPHAAGGEVSSTESSPSASAAHRSGRISHLMRMRGGVSPGGISPQQPDSQSMEPPPLPAALRGMEMGIELGLGEEENVGFKLE